MKPLKDIEFPIFAVSNNGKLYSENSILYYETPDGKIYTVDNKNLEGSFAKRRLQIPKDKRYKFPKTIFNFQGLLKVNYKTFVDSNGKAFTYKKTKRLKLIYRKVREVQPIEGKGYLVYVVGISYGFLLSASVYHREKYLGLLSINNGYIVYEATDERKKDTWKKA